MNDQIASALRSLLKIGGAYLVSRGLASDVQLEALIGGAVALAGIIWSYTHHKEEKPTAAPPTGGGA